MQCMSHCTTTAAAAADSHVGAELVERLVEVVHLHEDADDRHEGKAVGARMRELVVAIHRELERHAEALDAHHGHAADEGADGEIDERRTLAVRRHQTPDGVDGVGEDEEAVRQEA